MLQPYRNASLILKPKSIKYGLIRKPLEHKCKPPGPVKLFLYRLIGKKITHQSLFRCLCGQVWARDSRFTKSSNAWDKVPLKNWTDLGGVE